MPSRLASGNIRPQSTAMAASPYSMSIILRPNSPRPPRGMIFSGAILHAQFLDRLVADHAVFPYLIVRAAALRRAQSRIDGGMNLIDQQAEISWPKAFDRHRFVDGDVDGSGPPAPSADG